MPRVALLLDLEVPNPDGKVDIGKQLAEAAATFIRDNFNGVAVNQTMGHVLGLPEHKSLAEYRPELTPDTPTWETGLSIRARRSIERLGASTLRELSKEDPNRLFERSGFGIATFQEVLTYMRAVRLEFAIPLDSYWSTKLSKLEARYLAREIAGKLIPPVRTRPL